MSEVQKTSPVKAPQQEEKKEQGEQKPKDPNAPPREYKPKDPNAPPKEYKPREPRDPNAPPREYKPREPRDPNAPPREYKPREPRDPNAPPKEYKPREPRDPNAPPKEKRSQYVVKGEGGEAGGEKTQQQTEDQERRRQERQDKIKSRRQEREEKFVYDKNLVTLETVVAEIPKKHDQIQKPKRDDLDKKLDDLERQIDKIHDHLHKYIEDMRKTIYELKDKKDSVPMRELLKAKIAQKKEIREEFNKVKADFDTKKNDWNDLFDQSQKLRLKMKSLEKAEDIISELKRLKESQANDNLNPTQEKVICKQISDLEKSLPFAQPLDNLEKKMEVMRQEKGKVGKVMNELYKKLQELDGEITEYQHDLDDLNKNKETSQKGLDPIIQSKKQEFHEQIDKLKDKKKELVSQFHSTYDKFEEQEDFIRHTEWTQRQKDKLVKAEKQRKYEEDRLKRDEARAKRIAKEDAQDKELDDEESKKAKINPYLGLIELCEQLVIYCQKLQPSKVEVKAQKQEENKQNIDTILKSDEWKKDKVTQIKDKSEKVDEFASLLNPKKKKGQQQKKPQTATTDQKERLLEHAFQTMNLFDQIKVPIPFSPSDLEKTIKAIEERKEYYLKPDSNEPVSKAPVEEEKQEQNQRSSPKRNKKTEQRVDINEQEFPTF